MEAAPAARLADNQRPGPKLGVPPYHTAVFVPAHPRYVEAMNAEGHPVRMPYIAYELYEHPTNGTVAFAFTTPDKLVTALGDAQPWVATSLGPLAEGVAEHGAIVLLDPRVAPGHHNWQSADLATYAEEMR
ncbi:SAV_915 family protein [Streptomyces sp. YIM S03343]